MNLLQPHSDFAGITVIHEPDHTMQWFLLQKHTCVGTFLARRPSSTLWPEKHLTSLRKPVSHRFGTRNAERDAGPSRTARSGFLLGPKLGVLVGPRLVPSDVGTDGTRRCWGWRVFGWQGSRHETKLSGSQESWRHGMKWLWILSLVVDHGISRIQGCCPGWLKSQLDALEKPIMSYSIGARRQCEFLFWHGLEPQMSNGSGLASPPSSLDTKAQPMRCSGKTSVAPPSEAA